MSRFAAGIDMKKVGIYTDLFHFYKPVSDI